MKLGLSKRILVVDDEPQNIELLEGILKQLGYRADGATNGEEALRKIDENVSLVLLDIMMPGMDGFDVVKSIRANPKTADIPIIMVTALSGRGDRLRAVEAGANDFVVKPVDVTEMRVRINSLLKLKEAQDIAKNYMEGLEDAVERRMSELRKAMEYAIAAEKKTAQAHIDTIHRLGIAAEYRDEDTAMHIQRMSNYCRVLAEALKLKDEDIETIALASPMHDVGKIGISDTILFKPGKLTKKEFEIIKTHANIGAEILSGSTSHLLQAGEIIARTHHEKWDGSGYPNSLKGEKIPLWGRISAVGDVFDALTSYRPYKKPLPNDKVFAIIKKGKGSHFDPQLVDLFFDNIDKMLQVQKEFSKKKL